MHSDAVAENMCSSDGPSTASRYVLHSTKASAPFLSWLPGDPNDGVLADVGLDVISSDCVFILHHDFVVLEVQDMADGNCERLERYACECD